MSGQRPAPAADPLAIIQATPPGTAVEMLNLVRFHARAIYPADHPDAAMGRSGAEAYAEFGRITRPALLRVGGSISWRGTDALAFVGQPRDSVWDMAFIARYPDAGAFLALIRSEELARALVHRDAGVAENRIIRFLPASAGDSFSAGCQSDVEAEGRIC